MKHEVLVPYMYNGYTCIPINICWTNLQLHGGASHDFDLKMVLVTLVENIVRNLLDTPTWCL